MVKCAIVCCRNSTKFGKVRSFFRFPTDQKRFNEWVLSLKRPDLVDTDPKFWHKSGFRICSDHFLNIYFSSMLMNRLSKDAIPTVFPEEAGIGPYFEGEYNENFGMNDSTSVLSETNDQTWNESSDEHLSSNDKNGENRENGEVEDNETEENTEKETLANQNDTTETPKENGLDDKKDGTEKIAQNEGTTEEEDDFNPLLLCPDISMDVEESSVVTSNEENANNGNDDLDANSLFTPLFSTFVDEMTGAEISFNLTSEEQQLREKLYGPNNPVQFSKIHCTACNVHLGSALAGQTNRFVHPLLKVLICKECYHFYMSGEFEKDEDGSELYCRWCGQGGQVLCCSKCEYVFCKKCIRINFGRRKLSQVRDSDEWLCFRCDISQIKALRASCVEFFEYIREANARAAVMDDPDFINRDLATCCLPQSKKRPCDSEETEKEVRKSKKRKNEEDPDYDPFSEELKIKMEKVPEKSPITPTAPVPGPSGINKNLPPLLPKPKLNESTSGDNNTISTPVIQASSIKTVTSVPTSTIRIGNAILNVNLKPTNSGPGGRKEYLLATNQPQILRPILASRPIISPRTPIQMPSPRVPTVSARQVITPLVNRQYSLNRNQQSPLQKQNLDRTNVMKHEWFEKTVRAAARVNSNLSYTLTQLNKAQSNASSVEQLAVVHNKLQEVLSGSINSLIQIRKNLRTEFIAGIKTVKFPPKKTNIAKSSADDDVIIVNSTKATTATPTVTPQKIAANYPQISLKPAPKIEKNVEQTPPKQYLKVRSFSALQSVTSECITIPDDDIPPLVVPEPSKDKGNEEKGEEKENQNENCEKENEEIVKNREKKDDENAEENVEEKNEENVEEKNEENDEEKNEENNEEKDEENAEKHEEDDKIGKEGENEDTNSSENPVEPKENGEDAEMRNGDMEKEIVSDGVVQVKKEQEKEELLTETYNVKEKPSPKIKRMLSVKVNLKKVPIIEDKVKEEPIENGQNDETKND